MLPWQLTTQTTGLLTNENLYAILILSLTSLYAIKGGMVSVVATEVMQFTILTVTSLIIGAVAIYQVSPEYVPEFDSRGLGQSIFWLEARARIGRASSTR